MTSIPHAPVTRALTALLVCAVAVATQFGSAHRVGAATYGVVGYDISWPQCSQSTLQSSPSPPFDVAVVGVTYGRPFSNNPCLGAEFAWSRQATLPADLYVNLDFPTNARLHFGQSGPRGSCSGTNAACYAYNYGWNAVYGGDGVPGAVGYAHSIGVDATVWWLDVETSNNWQMDTGKTDPVANALVIQGAIDAFNSLGKTVGVYSTGYQWGIIAGSFAPQVPVWAAGASSVDTAPQRCDQAYSFTGGPVWMVQYTAGNFDGDYACTTQAGWEPLAGIHLATVDTLGAGNAAIAVDDNRVYVRLSNSASLSSTLEAWSTTPFYGSRATLFADLDGPGKPASAVAINDSSIWVEKNTTNGFGPPQAWSVTPFYGSRATLLADVDGSGRASAVAINDSSVWIMLNQGKGFGSPQLWSNVLFYGSRGTLAAVVDSSHRASIVAINDSSIWVMPSLGGSFGAPQLWSRTRFYGSRGTFMADVNGTGIAAAVAVNDSSIWVVPNGGAGFGAPQLWATGPFYGTWTYLADIDGSGRASAVAVNPTNIWIKKNNGGAFGPATVWFGGPFYGTH